MSDIKKIKDEYLLKLSEDLDVNQINEIKTVLFGKNGLVSSQFKRLGKIPEDERKKFSSELNDIKNELQNLIVSKIEEIEIKEINQKLEKEKVDITLPGRPFAEGKIHPVSQVIDEISSIFETIKFCNSSFASLSSEANFFLSSSTILPSCLNWELTNPFLPNKSVLI